MAFSRLVPVLLLSPLLLTPLALAQAPKPAGPPPTLKSVLLAQLRSTHNKAEWFVPVNTAVAGLTPEQARWIPKSEGPNNPAPEDHSVGMLAYHLLYWNIESLAQLKGEKPPPPPADNAETFNKFDATNWPDTVKKLDAVLTEIEQVVAAYDDAKVAANAERIAHIGTHNAYHTGQIIMIRKLQGSWDPKKGVS
jgi:DinB superfamily